MGPYPRKTMFHAKILLKNKSQIPNNPENNCKFNQTEMQLRTINYDAGNAKYLVQLFLARLFFQSQQFLFYTQTLILNQIVIPEEYVAGYSKYYHTPYISISITKSLRLSITNTTYDFTSNILYSSLCYPDSSFGSSTRVRYSKIQTWV